MTKRTKKEKYFLAMSRSSHRNELLTRAIERVGPGVGVPERAQQRAVHLVEARRVPRGEVAAPRAGRHGPSGGVRRPIGLRARRKRRRGATSAFVSPNHRPRSSKPACDATSRSSKRTKRTFSSERAAKKRRLDANARVASTSVSESTAVSRNDRRPFPSSATSPRFAAVAAAVNASISRSIKSSSNTSSSSDWSSVRLRPTRSRYACVTTSRGSRTKNTARYGLPAVSAARRRRSVAAARAGDSNVTKTFFSDASSEAPSVSKATLSSENPDTASAVTTRHGAHRGAFFRLEPSGGDAGAAAKKFAFASLTSSGTSGTLASSSSSSSSSSSRASQHVSRGSSARSASSKKRSPAPRCDRCTMSGPAAGRDALRVPASSGRFSRKAKGERVRVLACRLSSATRPPPRTPRARYPRPRRQAGSRSPRTRAGS